MQKLNIQSLYEQNIALKKEIEFLRGHPDLARGLKGESLIADLVSGKFTKNGTGHDVETTLGKIAIEVKYSSLLKIVEKRLIKRWVWTKLFGESGKKVYDRLILVGDADPRFASSYRDAASPYVFFDLSYRDAVELIGGVKLGRSAAIHLTTNPTSVRSKCAITLFNYFQPR